MTRTGRNIGEIEIFNHSSHCCLTDCNTKLGFCFYKQLTYSEVGIFFYPCLDCGFMACERASRGFMFVLKSAEPASVQESYPSLISSELIQVDKRCQITKNKLTQQSLKNLLSN